MQTWPAILPEWVMTDGYGEAPSGNVAEFKPEVGPPKRRRRTSVNTTALSVAFLTDSSGVDALLDFYRADLADGVLEFEKPHPRTGATMVCIMASPPAINAVSGMTYRATLELVRLF